MKSTQRMFRVLIFLLLLFKEITAEHQGKIHKVSDEASEAALVSIRHITYSVPEGIYDLPEIIDNITFYAEPGATFRFDETAFKDFAKKRAQPKHFEVEFYNLTSGKIVRNQLRRVRRLVADGSSLLNETDASITQYTTPQFSNSTYSETISPPDNTSITESSRVNVTANNSTTTEVTTVPETTTHNIAVGANQTVGPGSSNNATHEVTTTIPELKPSTNATELESSTTSTPKGVENTSSTSTEQVTGKYATTTPESQSPMTTSQTNSNHPQSTTTTASATTTETTPNTTTEPPRSATNTVACLKQIYELDREKTDVHYLTVSINTNWNDTRVQGETILIQINVEDVNDNSPVFVKSSLLSVITKEARVGEIVGQVKATDEDTGEYAKISYEMMSYTEREDNQTASPDLPTFGIESDTGLIFLSESVEDFVPPVKITFKVIAKDKAGNCPCNRATATATILIIDPHIPKETTTTNSTIKSNPVPVGGIVGGVIGFIVLVLIVGFLIWRHRRRKRNHDGQLVFMLDDENTIILDETV